MYVSHNDIHAQAVEVILLNNNLEDIHDFPTQGHYAKRYLPSLS